MTRRCTTRRPLWALPADAQTGLESLLRPSLVSTSEGPIVARPVYRIADADTSQAPRGPEADFQAQDLARRRAEKLAGY